MLKYTTCRKIGFLLILIAILLIYPLNEENRALEIPYKAVKNNVQDSSLLVARHIIILYNSTTSMLENQSSKSGSDDRVERLNQYIESLICEGADEFAFHLENNKQYDKIINGDINSFKKYFGNRLLKDISSTTVIKFGFANQNLKTQITQIPNKYLDNFFHIIRQQNIDVLTFLGNNLPDVFQLSQPISAYAESQYLRALNLKKKTIGDLPFARRIIVMTASEINSITVPDHAHAPNTIEADNRRIQNTSHQVAAEIDNAHSEYLQNYFYKPNKFCLELRGQKGIQPIYLTIKELTFNNLERPVGVILDTLKVYHAQDSVSINLNALSNFSNKFKFLFSKIKVFSQGLEITDSFVKNYSGLILKAPDILLANSDSVRLDLVLEGIYNQNSQFIQSMPIAIQNSFSIPVVKFSYSSQKLTASFIWAIIFALPGLVFLFLGFKEIDPQIAPIKSPDTVLKLFDGQSIIEIPLDAENELDLRMLVDDKNLRRIIGKITIGDATLNSTELTKFLMDDTPIAGVDGIFKFTPSSSSDKIEQNGTYPFFTKLSKKNSTRSTKLLIDTTRFDINKLPLEENLELDIPLIYTYHHYHSEKIFFEQNTNLSVHFNCPEGKWELLDWQVDTAALEYSQNSEIKQIGKLRFQNPVFGSHAKVKLKISDLTVMVPFIRDNDLKFQRVPTLDFKNMLSFSKHDINTETETIILGNNTHLDVYIWLHFAHIKLPEHSYTISFIVDSVNDEKNFSCDFQFQILRPTADSNILAIDFGNSAISVAASILDFKQELIEPLKAPPPIVADINDVYDDRAVDFERKPELLSSIFSLRRKDKTATNGKEPLVLALGDAAYRQSQYDNFFVCASLKKLFARRKNIQGIDTNKIFFLTCEEVLKRAFENIEQQGINNAAVRELVLTCPDNLTFAQKQLLLTTFQKIALNKESGIPRFIRIRLISESEALTHYYLSKEPNREHQSEIILVVDVGGGLTSIALNKISYLRKDNVPDVTSLCCLNYNLGADMLDSYIARVLWGIILKLVPLPPVVVDNLFKLQLTGNLDNSLLKWFSKLRSVLKKEARQIKFDISSNVSKTGFNITVNIHRIISELANLADFSAFHNFFEEYKNLSLPNIFLDIRDRDNTENEYKPNFFDYNIFLNKNQHIDFSKIKISEEQQKSARDYLSYHDKIIQFPKIISEEFIEDIFKKYKSIYAESGILKIDVLLIVGRGSNYRKMNEDIIQKVKEHNLREKDVLDVLDLTNDRTQIEVKTCLAKGAVYSGLIYRVKEQTPAHCFFSKYGLIGLDLISKQPYYEELIPVATPCDLGYIEKEINVRLMKNEFFLGQIYGPDEVTNTISKQCYKYTLIKKIKRKSNNIKIKYRIYYNNHNELNLFEDEILISNSNNWYIYDDLNETLYSIWDEEFLVNTFFPETFNNF